MKRREFLNWVGLGLLASCFPVALAACSKTSSNNNNTALSNGSDGGNFVSIGTSEELQKNGYLLDKNSKVIVVKDSNNQILAVNSVCTHRGCTVEWQKDSNTLLCPCHDAKFSPNGQVLSKPAKTPLASYEVKEENGAVLVKTS
ncbi:MAG: ubiquinol-cytochrome c reductase iron-sulfur subunit [Waterburya sp.]